MDNTYGCDICGDRYDWDTEIVWLSANVGICPNCEERLASDEYFCPECETRLVRKDELDDYNFVCLECGKEYTNYEGELD